MNVQIQDFQKPLHLHLISTANLYYILKSLHESAKPLQRKILLNLTSKRSKYLQLYLFMSYT